MKGSCPTCVEKQGITGFEDYCCVVCVVRLAVTDARMYKDEHGTTIVDLSGGT